MAQDVCADIFDSVRVRACVHARARARAHAFVIDKGLCGRCQEEDKARLGMCTELCTAMRADTGIGECTGPCVNVYIDVLIPAFGVEEVFDRCKHRDRSANIILVNGLFFRRLGHVLLGWTCMCVCMCVRARVRELVRARHRVRAGERTRARGCTGRVCGAVSHRGPLRCAVT